VVAQVVKAQLHGVTHHLQLELLYGTLHETEHVAQVNGVEVWISWKGSYGCGTCLLILLSHVGVNHLWAVATRAQALVFEGFVLQKYSAEPIAKGRTQLLNDFIHSHEVWDCIVHHPYADTLLTLPSFIWAGDISLVVGWVGGCGIRRLGIGC
jgi:hypothetical protein